LEEKKGELELIRAKNMKISRKNILRKELEDLVPEYEAAYFSISDLEPIVSCPTL